jgi:Rieske Fe-S protein
MRDRPVDRFDPGVTPLPRRRVLALMGAGASAVATGGGLGVLLGGCVGPPIPVQLDVDPATLETGVPVEHEFTLDTGGAQVEASVWLVKQESGEIVAFDPRCTHGLCSYWWSDEDDLFNCHCHEGSFKIDGTVNAGPPPRQLDRWPMTMTGGTMTVDVPANFATPRESLP